MLGREHGCYIACHVHFSLHELVVDVDAQHAAKGYVDLHYSWSSQRQEVSRLSVILRHHVFQLFHTQALHGEVRRAAIYTMRKPRNMHFFQQVNHVQGYTQALIFAVDNIREY